MSSPIAIGGLSHDISTKPGHNPLKNLRQCDYSTFIRNIATIVQWFFISTTTPGQSLSRQITGIVTEP